MIRWPYWILAFALYGQIQNKHITFYDNRRNRMKVIGKKNSRWRPAAMLDFYNCNFTA